MRILLVLAVALTVAVTAQASSSSAQLRISGFAPLLVRGSGFHAREHVLVRMSFGTTAATKTVVASRSGGFSVSFQTGADTQCGQLVVTARGATGSKASSKAPRAPCGIPPAPLEP